MCGSVKLWSTVADITPEELAKDGFYFLKKRDHCACCFCRGIIGAWEEGDTVRGEHKRHFRNCPFINGSPVGNVPMYLCEQLETMWRETVVKRLKDRNRSSSSIIYEDFSLLQYREASFTSSAWSMGMKNKLAFAGFYSFIDLNDFVRCFRCGLGLWNWSNSMDPLKMHAKYSPDCMMVKLFIDHLVAQTHHDWKTRVNDELVDLVIEQGDIERNVTNMGFPLGAVKAAVKNRLLDECIKFYTVADCIEAVLVTLEQGHRAEKAVAQTLANIARRDEERMMDAIDIIETRSLPPHQQQQEQPQELIGNEPSYETLAASFSRRVDSIVEVANFDMEAGEVSGERADETIAVLSEEERPTALKAEETTANAEDLELDEEPSVKNVSKSNIMLELVCKVCLYEEADILLLPCRNLCMCPNCALSIKKCHVCRSNIEDIIKIIRC